MTSRLLTFREAAKALGVNQVVLHDALLKGRIAWESMGEGQEIRFKPEALERYKTTLKRRETVRTAQPCVYVVGFAQYVKIGLTRNLKDRLEKLQTHAPEEVQVFKVFDGEGIDLERKLHKRFKRHRLKGEWFSRALELDLWIKEGCPL